MVSLIKGIGAILAILLIAEQLTAQQAGYMSDERHGPARIQGQSNLPSVNPVAVNPTTSSAPSSSSPSANMSSGSSAYMGSGAGYSGVYLPNIQQTSFNSTYLYYTSHNYYSYLSRQFSFEPFYFNRFYRNKEPLITPSMLRLDLAIPVSLSSQILHIIDQLEVSLRDEWLGEPADKDALISKSKRIQELAKQIRRNRTISYINNSEARKGQTVYRKGDIAEALSPEALNKLREMATDLNGQLRRMYNQSSTSTVSVEHFSEPSLESLAKGIERLGKDIQNSSKGM